jgi:hypothetical protein
MDNRYTRYELFRRLRTLNIGAVGTVAANYTMGHFQKEAAVTLAKYKWGTVYFEAIGRDVKHKKTTKGVVTTIVKREGDSDVAIKQGSQ